MITLLTGCLILVALGLYLTIVARRRFIGSLFALLGVVFGFAAPHPTSAVQTLSLAQFSLRVRREASPEEQADSLAIAADPSKLPDPQI